MADEVQYVLLPLCGSTLTTYEQCTIPLCGVVCMYNSYPCNRQIDVHTNAVGIQTPVDQVTVSCIVSSLPSERTVV